MAGDVSGLSRYKHTRGFLRFAKKIFYKAMEQGLALEAGRLEGWWLSEHTASLAAKASLTQVAGLHRHLVLLVLTRMGIEPFPWPPLTSAALYLFLLLG